MDNNHQKPRTSKIGNGRIVDSVEGTFSIENIYKIRPKKNNPDAKIFCLWLHFRNVVMYLRVLSPFIPNLSELH